ncbi:hypothetical protein BOX15_Mlig029931g1 [Macrostomum lignano]|uniref:Cytochrome P450 n=1 Tax=Macrostomum lignano TaxID=282301 RepID=A0A267FDC3_9PLAT|nr:hypothetical protein BOX15_Mlig029931g1 [Macrostomum lignano]
MATATTLAIAGGAAALGFYWFSSKRFNGKDAPSVGRYPMIGSLRHLPEPMYLSLYERFGTEPIVRVYFGTQCVYVFNRWSAFKEAMVDNAEQLSGRQSQTLAASVFGDIGGIVMSDGEIWREYRRFTLKTLRDFGFGRRGAEEIIAVETDHLHRSIEAAAGAPMDTTVLMSSAASNIICQLVFGSRLASEDPYFHELLDVFHKISQAGSSNITQSVVLSVLAVVDRLPMLLPLLKLLPSTSVTLANFKKLHDYCCQQRDKHAAEMEKVDRAKDYIEAHLQHQNIRPELFNDTRLAMAVTELFLAGTDTTANTLRWAILFMIENPDVADKVYEEIVEKIGRERLPTMQDRSVLHYTQAAIEEVHRRASLVPLGVLHRITSDITVSGVPLKADSICAFNVYSIHHDPELFPEPTKFLPERHLKDNQFVPCPHLATFGLGRRACLGESLARMELFVFFSALMQRYRFSLDPQDSRTLWDLTEDPEIFKGNSIRTPAAHKIIFSYRA